MANPNLSNRKRLLILFYAAMFLLLVLVFRLGQLMLFDADNLQDMAETQWTRELAVTPQRGDIVDRNGEVLATSATVESVLLHPQDIEDPGEVANLLAPILEMDAQEIFDAASDKSKIEVWLKRQISTEQADQIKALELDGVDFFTDTKRYYLYNDFASQVLGYTNADGEGQEGLEKYYNKYLAGYPGVMLALVDAKGRTIANSEQVYVEPQEGLNLQLAMDARIQSFAEAEARDALEVNDAKAVSCIVMDPNNGDVLAMVNYPEADLNNLDRSDLTQLAELSRNRAVVDAYEPGSTFKIITTASALDSGAATLDTHYNCPGYKIVDGEQIKCWRTGRPHGDQDLTTAVQNSCNPAFMTMALEMGTDTFYEYMTNFGFGQTTGVDYSADAAGILRASKYVKNVDLARIGFGQSVAVTPLQLCAAVSAVINGGTLYTPRMATALTDSNGNVVEELEVKEVRQVISEDTSEKMRTILESVVSMGSGKNAQIEGYRVGGKTGTAQIYDESGKIVEGKHISSFIGFAPADDPQFLCLFIVYEPNVSVDFGSVVAAPFTKNILEKCLKMAGIPPTETQSEKVQVPDFTGKTLEEAEELAEQAGVVVNFNGSGVVTAQSPVARTEVLRDSLVELIGEEMAEEEGVPDVRGKSLSVAFTILNQAGLDMEVVDQEAGNGYVKTQSPEAGTPITPDIQKVTVTCGTKEETDVGKPEDA